jgi:hypothetical protein
MTVGPILHVWMTVFAGVMAFGAAGLAATTFLPHKHLSLMAAPLAGIALWPLATLALYVGMPPALALSFDSAAYLAMSVLVLLGFLLIWLSGITFGAAWRSLATVAAACAIVAPIMMMASIDRGEPALLYVDGTDHMGYSHVADWFRSHTPQPVIAGTVGPAVADPSQPYSAWPHLEVTTEPRGGAFAYLALVSIVSGQPAAFSFDAATAIVLIAACLGCAAVFSRSWGFLICLAAALLTGLWYDYGHMGFLGKLLSYPLALFAFGVFTAFYRSNAGPGEVLALSMLAAGAGLMHNGEAWAFLFVWLAAPFLLASAIIQRKSPSVADFSLAAFPPIVAMATSGTLARPLNTAWYPDYSYQWEKVVYQLADLNSVFPEVSSVSRTVLFAIFFAGVVAWGALTLYATAKRNASALALLLGPAALIIALYALDQRPTAVQLAGFPYPAFLCAAFLLAQQREPSAKLRHALAVGALVVLVSVHIPRTIGSVRHYTIDANRNQMFAVSDFDRLQSAIGDEEVYVDIRGNMWNVLPIMVELGRRNVKLVWSPESWFVAASFRGWAAPVIEKIPDLRLTDATAQKRERERIVVETRRYKLLRLSDNSPPMALP